MPFVETLPVNEPISPYAASKKAVGEATENALKGMTDDFTKWVKNATKTNTGKVAIAAVGAAVIGAVIGLMLKPSKKEA